MAPAHVGPEDHALRYTAPAFGSSTAGLCLDSASPGDRRSQALVPLQGPLLPAETLQIVPPDCCPLVCCPSQMGVKEELWAVVVWLIDVRITLQVRTASHHGCPSVARGVNTCPSILMLEG